MTGVEKIPYVVKRSARRTIALCITRNGSLEVRAPLWADIGSIERFILSKRGWIRRKTEDVKKFADAASSIRDGGKILLFGNEHVLSLSPGTKKVSVRGGTILCPSGSGDEIKKHMYAFLRKEARAYLSRRVVELAKRYSFSFSKLRISSARTRWGSCSSGGTVSFSFRLVMASVPVIDSVILHELCHTREMNHSKRFYSHLLACDPEYKKHSKWLKDHRGVMAL
jgi:predicted metal-dependent hydrolase